MGKSGLRVPTRRELRFLARCACLIAEPLRKGAAAQVAIAAAIRFGAPPFVEIGTGEKERRQKETGGCGSFSRSLENAALPISDWK